MTDLLGVARTIWLVAPAAMAWLSGVVTDEESRRPVPGAWVTLVDLERGTSTDSAGAFRLDGVPPGPQHVTVSRVGYASRTFHALVPSDGALVIDVALEAKPVAIEGIEVRAPLPVRGLEVPGDSRYPNRGLSLAAVRHHPLVAEADVLEATSGGEIILQPESPSGVHVRGGASDHLAHLLDGIPVFSPYHAGGTFSSFNPDALSRIDLASSPPPPDAPSALAGVLAARTRAPSDAVQFRGGLSTTQVRGTLDAPLGSRGGGVLVAVRSTFPGLAPRLEEASYLGGKGRDGIARLDAPALGGRLWAIGHASTTDIEAAAVPPETLVPTGIAADAQNRFGGDSYSYGGGWTRTFGQRVLEVRGWSALGDGEVRWNDPDSLVLDLETRRTDAGGLARVSFGPESSRTIAGLRAERTHTRYSLTSSRNAPALTPEPKPAPTPEPALELPTLSFRSKTTLVTAFLEHHRAIAPTVEVDLACAGTRALSAWWASPSISVTWEPSSRAAVTIGYARRHQFAQSFRNPESAVSNIFPIDLFVGAGSRGGVPRVPVARAHAGYASFRHRASAHVQWGAQLYANESDGLALVAPRDAEPFATTGHASGAGTTRGAALEVSAAGMRYAFLGSYGLQRTRLVGGGVRYIPQSAAIHTVAAGVLFHPSPSASLRLGLTAAFGRRATPATGAFEWEACNLLDQGCEFAGSPLARPDALGTVRLPAYFRVDLGARKHWHVNIGGRDAELALFGVMTNLLGRVNRLTEVEDPSSGERSWIDMRPRSPLVAGLEWRF